MMQFVNVFDEGRHRRGKLGGLLITDKAFARFNAGDIIWRGETGDAMT